MGSDENKPQLRMSLELNQEKQPKKKGCGERLRSFSPRGQRGPIPNTGKIET